MRAEHSACRFKRCGPPASLSFGVRRHEHRKVKIMKTYTFIVLGLLAFGGPVLAATLSEEAATELKALQGTWTVAYSEQNGERRRDLEEVKKMRLTIKNDKWILEFHNNVGDKRVATLKL